MARPIEPTPPLEGRDAEELAESLKETASREEMRRRREAAKRFRDKVTQTKNDGAEQ